ncbi:MAG: hypothetical protein NT002_10180 [candidate division Zixibacteria bacterium]|nr:hypothetical protein [candidate division Zixibacteria bacterium]
MKKRANHMKVKKTKEILAIYLRVLGYQESDHMWAAHCLEMDIVGYGKNFQNAVNNLKELIEMQISFAIHKGQPTLLDRPAPAEIIEVYNRLFRLNLERPTETNTVDRKRRITSIPFPRNLLNSDFCIAQA